MSELITQGSGGVLPASADYELDKLLAQDVVEQGYEIRTTAIDMYKAKGATLSFQGVDFPGAKTLVYVLDFIYETTIHHGAYDPKQTEFTPPKAFAIGRDKSKLVWHENSDPAYAGKLCATTPECQIKGKGIPKEAKECIRVALLQAGEFDRNSNQYVYSGVDKDKLVQGKIGFFRVSPTAVWDFENYVVSLQKQRLPLWAAQTLFAWSPNTKSAYNNCRAYFNKVGRIEPELYEVVKARHQDARSLIDYIYDKPEDVVEPVETKPKKY